MELESLVVLMRYRIKQGLSVCVSGDIKAAVKPGFHYLSSRAELTARELWCIF